MISEQKAARLRALSTRDGTIAALAVDQRNSLRIPLANAASKSPEQISGAQLAEFKSAVTAVLSPHASAVLLDPEYGVEAFFHRAPGCGLIVTYEMDGFDNPRPHRMLALMQEYSVRRLRDLGAHGIKILLSWSPFDDERANDLKRALIERIGAECRGLDMPFFLEPVGYDPGGLDPKGLEYARLKPEIVIRSIEEFSKDYYNVDVLKVEFPVSPCFLGAAYTREQALEHFHRVDAAAKRPYIYLSAGVSIGEFTASLQLAGEAKARFSGVLCGRAIWQDGIPAYLRGGVPVLESWLEDQGVSNLQAVIECLRAAVPCVPAGAI